LSFLVVFLGFPVGFPALPAPNLEAVFLWLCFCRQKPSCNFFFRLHLGSSYMIFGPAGNRRFLVFGRPRRPQTPFQRWGAKPPTFCNGFGAAQTPNMDDFRPAPKPRIKRSSVSSSFVCLPRSGGAGTRSPVGPFTADESKIPGSAPRRLRQVLRAYPGHARDPGLHL
jgi:hypothetical protein